MVNASYLKHAGADGRRQIETAEILQKVSARSFDLDAWRQSGADADYGAAISITLRSEARSVSLGRQQYF